MPMLYTYIMETEGMADHLYLSLWFSDFPADEMLPHLLRVMRQFPFSAQQPGIAYFALHAVSWTEPTILEQRFTPNISPEGAILFASEHLHSDNAYNFEAFWDLWLPAKDNGEWEQRPSRVTFIVRGTEFDEGASEQEGHIQVDFGIDSHFLLEEVPLTEWSEQRVRANIQKLVEFTNKVEKQSGASARLLWSESEENFAQKLIARLQKVQ
ncbi:MAG: hypothetical protein NVS9B5_26000 [Terriglobales bacterium]